MPVTDITPFAFGDHMVRARMDEHGNPWFVVKDVCRVLDISNHRDAVAQLDDDERDGVGITDSMGREQQNTIISESGLYALVFRSRKPEAKAFSKWVRAELLPTLRKTGSYAMPRPQMSLPSPRRPPDLPVGIPPAALELRPAMRQRLWRDALETARMDGGGIDLATVWFEKLCLMVGAQRHAGDTWQATIAFMDQCLETVKGQSTSAYAIYAAFRQWWGEHEQGPPPGQRYLAQALRSRFYPAKSSTMRYRNCVLKC